MVRLPPMFRSPLIVNVPTAGPGKGGVRLERDRSEERAGTAEGSAVTMVRAAEFVVVHDPACRVVTFN